MAMARVFENNGEFGRARIQYEDLIANAGNQLLPMRSGELTYPYLMKRNLGISYVKSGTGLFWFRLLDLHTLASIALLSVLAGTLEALALGQCH